MNGSHDSLELWANAIDSIRFDGDASALIELLLSRSMPMQVQSKLADLFDPADPGVSPHVLKPIRQKRSIQILKTIHKKLSTGYQLLYKTAG